jgi:hypothetical protein
MVEMGAKIKRKTYRFDLKKKYQYVSHFRIKERPPIEKIKEAIKKFTTPKKPEKKLEPIALSAPPKGGFNFVVFTFLPRLLQSPKLRQRAVVQGVRLRTRSSPATGRRRKIFMTHC